MAPLNVLTFLIALYTLINLGKLLVTVYNSLKALLAAFSELSSLTSLNE